MRGWIERTKSWARDIKRDVLVLWIAARDLRTPLIAKAVAAAVVAYALSPIDLIPDFVPVLGYLDELLIVPAGIMLAVRLIPPDLLAVFRVQATEAAERPASRVGAAIIVLLWAAGAGALLWALWPEAIR